MMRTVYRDSNGLTASVDGEHVTIELHGRSVLNSAYLSALIGALSLALNDISSPPTGSDGDTHE